MHFTSLSNALSLFLSLTHTHAYTEEKKRKREKNEAKTKKKRKRAKETRLKLKQGRNSKLFPTVAFENGNIAGISPFDLTIGNATMLIICPDIFRFPPHSLSLFLRLFLCLSVSLCLFVSFSVTASLLYVLAQDFFSPFCPVKNGQNHSQIDNILVRIALSIKSEQCQNTKFSRSRHWR